MAEAPRNTHNKRSLIRTSHVCHRRHSAGRDQVVEEYKHTHTHTHARTRAHTHTLMMAMSLNDVTILDIHDADYRCIINGISKNKKCSKFDE